MSGLEQVDVAAWLPNLPRHWDRKRLKLLFRLMGGGTPSKDQPEYWLGDMPWVSSKDMKVDVITDTEDHISEEAIRSSATNIVPDETILMVARSGILKHTIPIAITGRCVAINQDIKAFIPIKAGLDARYYAFLIKGFQDQLLTLWRSQGATVESLDTEIIGNTDLPLPPPDEQRAIADFLDRETAKIDALIAKQNELVSALLEARSRMMWQAITKGLNPSFSLKESEVQWIGMIPSHWDVRKLIQIAKLESGHTPSRQKPEYWENCDIPWVSLADVHQFRNGRTEYIRNTSEKISRLGMANSAARLLPAGTVILSRTASVGFSTILGVDMATTQDFVNWICGPRLDNHFLLRCFWSMGRDFERLFYGSTHKTIYMPDVKTFTIPLPPLSEQRAIVNFIRHRAKNIDDLVEKARHAAELLNERSAALITAAITGQIDVRAEPIRADAVAPNDNQQALRVVVGAEIVARHGTAKNFGRVKFQKLLYLAEVHIGISELGGNYVREAAGPLARDLLSATEHGMAASGFYKAVAPLSENDGVAYERVGTVGAHRDQFTALLGEKAVPLTKLIDLLKDYSTRDVEAITTLYAVWNDALLDGEGPDDARIIRGFLDEWHPEKRVKFKAADLPVWLAWMRRNGVVPSGSGTHTYTDQLFV